MTRPVEVVVAAGAAAPAPVTLTFAPGGFLRFDHDVRDAVLVLSAEETVPLAEGGRPAGAAWLEPRGIVAGPFPEGEKTLRIVGTDGVRREFKVPLPEGGITLVGKDRMRFP
jgi:hypothetical protein